MSLANRDFSSRRLLRSFSGLRRCPRSVAAATFGATLPFSSATRAKTGGKGIRTPGLLIANETLYQLSYTPVYL